MIPSGLGLVWGHQAWGETRPPASGAVAQQCGTEADQIHTVWFPLHESNRAWCRSAEAFLPKLFITIYSA